MVSQVLKMSSDHCLCVHEFRQPKGICDAPYPTYPPHLDRLTSDCYRKRKFTRRHSVWVVV